MCKDRVNHWKYSLIEKVVHPVENIPFKIFKTILHLHTWAKLQEGLIWETKLKETITVINLSQNMFKMCPTFKYTYTNVFYQIRYCSIEHLKSYFLI